MAFPYATTLPGLTTTLQQLRSVFPPKVTAETLKKWNIAANNESSILATLRFIGLVDEEGTKQPGAAQAFVQHEDAAFASAFGELVKQGYASLFELYGDEAWKLDRSKLIGFFRTSDQTSARVGDLQAATFTALASLAGHAPAAASSNGNGSTPRPRTPARRSSPEARVKQQAAPTPAATTVHLSPAPSTTGSPFTISVRIELNLPVSENQEVYDNIFRSIRENLINANA
jgi:hypothetical protein